MIHHQWDYINWGQFFGWDFSPRELAWLAVHIFGEFFSNTCRLNQSIAMGKYVVYHDINSVKFINISSRKHSNQGG